MTVLIDVSVRGERAHGTENGESSGFRRFGNLHDDVCAHHVGPMTASQSNRLLNPPKGIAFNLNNDGIVELGRK